MTRRPLGGLLVLSVLVVALGGLPGPPGGSAVRPGISTGSQRTPGASWGARPPRLEFETITLPNGLTAVLSPDHATPIVHLQVWYHVGSKDERPGRTGFAHLFEHLMFKGSKNVGPEQHASMISRVGGLSNAYTTEDATVFWETVPSQYLPLVLWLEADRMASLKVDRDSFAREREVVKEERRTRVENQPYGRLPEIIAGHAFTVHPYHHATIGSMADLEAASVDDVRQFYRTYYVPSNATAVLVGDFDTARASDLVRKYLGRVPKAERPVPRDIPAEPPQKAERRATLHENWPLPVVVAAYHVPFDGHPDAYPLQIAAKILSDGQSARIYRKLVYETGIALAAFGGGDFLEDPGLFYAVAVVQPGHAAPEAEAALLGEMDRLRAQPPADAEMSKAKNQFARDYLVGRESTQQKASQLGHAAVIHHGDVASADSEFDLLMKTTASDVQRVAQSYFRPENRVLITILPTGPGPGAPANARGARQ